MSLALSRRGGPIAQAASLEPPILLPVTKGPYAAGSSLATVQSGATGGDVIGLQSGTFAWGQVSPMANVTFQGVTGTVITGEMVLTNAGTCFRNCTIRASAPTTQKTVVDILNDDVEIRWCDLDGNGQSAASPHPAVVFLGGISTQVFDVIIANTKIHGVADSAGSQAHGVYCAFPGAGDRFDKCWIYDFPGYGLHYNTDGDDSVAERCVIDDSALRGGVVFDTEGGGGGPTGNIIRNCAITAADGGGSGIGAVHIVQGSNTVENSRLITPGITTPGTGSVTNTGNTVADTTFLDEAARDYRVPGNASFQFIAGPL